MLLKEGSLQADEKVAKLSTIFSWNMSIGFLDDLSIALMEG